MFTFQRLSAGSAEVWSIIIAEGTLPHAEKRFGVALRTNARRGDEGPSSFHEIGTLCAVTHDDGTEILLGCKHGLTEAEKRTLFVELELLLGKESWSWGSEEQPGWFMHGVMKPWSGKAASSRSKTSAKRRGPKPAAR